MSASFNARLHALDRDAGTAHVQMKELDPISVCDRRAHQLQLRFMRERDSVTNDLRSCISAARRSSASRCPSCDCSRVTAACPNLLLRGPISVDELNAAQLWLKDFSKNIVLPAPFGPAIT